MARELKVQYPGAIDLVMTRGDRREAVLKDDTDSERIVTEELKRGKWDARFLARRRKGDEAKLAIARRLRTETTMTLAWIAELLVDGDPDLPGALAALGTPRKSMNL